LKWHVSHDCSNLRGKVAILFLDELINETSYLALVVWVVLINHVHEHWSPSVVLGLIIRDLFKHTISVTGTTFAKAGNASRIARTASAAYTAKDYEEGRGYRCGNYTCDNWNQIIILNFDRLCRRATSKY
jgi:hypothetical protein